MKKFLLSVVMTMTALAIVLALVNSHEVTVNFLVAKGSTSMAFLVVLVFAIGALVGAGAALLLTATGKARASAA